MVGKKMGRTSVYCNVIRNKHQHHTTTPLAKTLPYVTEGGTAGDYDG